MRRWRVKWTLAALVTLALMNGVVAFVLHDRTLLWPGWCILAAPFLTAPAAVGILLRLRSWRKRPTPQDRDMLEIARWREERCHSMVPPYYIAAVVYFVTGRLHLFVPLVALLLMYFWYDAVLAASGVRRENRLQEEEASAEQERMQSEHLGERIEEPTEELDEVECWI